MRSRPAVCVLENPAAPHQLAQRLRSEGFRVPRSTYDPALFLSALARRLPSVAVVDVSSADRVPVVEALARAYPTVRTVVAVPRLHGALARRCAASGAFRCVEKRRDGAKRLALAVHAAHGVGEDAGAQAAALLRRLTPREREVLRHVGGGSDNLKIGALLGITERTVKAHVGSLYKKLGADNRVELALAARGLGG